jgi:hypothetical protein
VESFASGDETCSTGSLVDHGRAHDFSRNRANAAAALTENSSAKKRVRTAQKVFGAAIPPKRS